jgi:diguanylate cyclase (GGDEF)-like protein
MTAGEDEIERADALVIPPPEIGVRPALLCADPVPGAGDAENGLSGGIFATAMIALKIASVVAVVQMALLFAFSSIEDLEKLAPDALLDSLILGVIAAPLVVLWIVRPYIAERQDAYGKMAEMNRMLLAEIDERMAAQEKLRIKEHDLELQIQDIAYVKELVEAQASEAVGLAEDLAIQKKAVEESERRNEYLANHDTLTELPNRRHFEETLVRMKSTAGERNRAVSLIYADLDNFKMVNDTLGHQRGDELLREVAQTLRNSLREGDFVARLGGDEFAILSTAFSGSDDTRLTGFAERMRKALTIDVDGPDGLITVSVALGVACMPEDAKDQVALL